jgi:hypothetical protein
MTLLQSYALVWFGHASAGRSRSEIFRADLRRGVEQAVKFLVPIPGIQSEIRAGIEFVRIEMGDLVSLGSLTNAMDDGRICNTWFGSREGSRRQLGCVD